jgi:prefoldin subunit 5
MRSPIFLVSLILLSIILPIVSNAAFTAGNLTIISPPYNNYTYKQGDKFNVTFQSSYANAPVIIAITTPENKTYTIPGQTDSRGIFSSVLWTWSYPNESIGKYTIAITVSPPGQTPQAGSFVVNFVPGNIVINVKVVNQFGLAIPQATVTIVDLSTQTQIGQQMTNSSGFATFSILFIPGKTYSLQIQASAPGYAPSTQTVTIASPGTYTYTLTLMPPFLSVVIQSIKTGAGVTIPFIPLGSDSYFTQIAEGQQVTLTFAIKYQNQPVTPTSLSVTLTLPNGTRTLTPTSVSTGVYTVNFSLPTATYNYVALLNITASYQSLTKTVLLGISAYQDLTTVLAQVNKTITDLRNSLTLLNQTVQAQKATINSLNSSISSLKATVSQLTTLVTTLNTTVKQLQSQITTLSSRVDTLSSNISSLQSSLQSSLTLIYVAIGLAIIALIIAIVALVQLLRKVR